MSVRIEVPPRIEPKGLERLWRGLSSLEDGQVAVLRASEPGTFCAGMDLQAYAHGSPEELNVPLKRYGECLVLLQRAPCPTIAVVEGPAMGGGFGLAAACDVVLVSDAACFGLPEATFGLVPGMVFAAVAERLSPARLRRLALQTDSIDADSALAWGLADARLEDRTLSRWVRRLSRVAPGAVTAVRQATASDFARRVTAGRQLTESLLSQPQVQQRVRRFVDEGIAPWQPLEEA